MPIANKTVVLGRRCSQDSAPFIRLDAGKIRLPNGEIISSFCQLILEDFGVVVRKSGRSDTLLLKQYKQGGDSLKAGLPRFFLNPPKGCLEEKEIVLTRMKGPDPAKENQFVLFFNHASAVSLALEPEFDLT